MTDTGDTGTLPDTGTAATNMSGNTPAKWYIITAEETNEVLMNLDLIERTVQGPAREHVRMVAEIITRVERRMA